MSTVLGKRKSWTRKADPSVTEEEARAIFQRHFEARFEPLEPTETDDTNSSRAPNHAIEDLAFDSDASEDSWPGLSSENGDQEGGDSDTSDPSATVEVVSHINTVAVLPDATISKRERKEWLSSRPPSTSIHPEASTAATATKPEKKSSTAEEDAPSLLKNDLELRRLLSESHLLSSSTPDNNNNNTEHTGRNRHLATDLRITALGSKTSIYRQAKMPMSHRKGIIAKAAGREARRRQEARENGIILERPGRGGGGTVTAAAAAGVPGKKAAKEKRKAQAVATGKGRRERPVDAPAVGKMSHGMLKLSRKDIAEIQGGSGGRGSSSTAGFKRKRRR